MGAIAEALTAYAQPLLAETDGSIEQLNKALGITQLCYNLSLLPEEKREQVLGETRLSLEMSDEEFDDFRRRVIVPMIHRHQQMFPLMHNRRSSGVSHSVESLSESPGMATRGEKAPLPGRYEPCPCNSGRKYKFCCGKKGV